MVRVAPKPSGAVQRTALTYFFDRFSATLHLSLSFVYLLSELELGLASLGLEIGRI